MPPLGRSQRSRTERRDHARDRLLLAVEEILQEGDSFASIKVEDLSARAGMSRATFYIHFQDKVELLEAWLRESRGVLLDACNAWYEAEPGLSRERLQQAIAGIIDTYRSRMDLMRAAHETALYDSELRDAFGRAFDRHFEGLTQHIERGQSLGDIAPDLFARETAEWLVCMLERVPLVIPRDASAKELAHHADAATEIVWVTLYAPARGDGITN